MPVPPIPGLADVPFWTSTDALVAEELPRHLLVLGGSLVAVELAQAFRRLGAEVTLMARSTLLSKEDPALGADRAAVTRALAELPDDQRQVMTLAYYEGLSCSEIAERMGLTKNMVEKYMIRTLRHLREHLDVSR